MGYLLLFTILSVARFGGIARCSLSSGLVCHDHPHANYLHQRSVIVIVQAHKQTHTTDRLLFSAIAVVDNIGVRAIFWRGAGSILPEKYGAAPEK